MSVPVPLGRSVWNECLSLSIDALQDTIDQQTDELKDLKEKNDDLASQLKSQMMVNAKR